MEQLSVKVEFDRENIIELLLAQDMSENARIELSNVSSDKRCRAESQSFYVGDISYDSPYSLRLFTMNDAI